ncbi:HXXEE domain-containing protein [Chloroflexia bacterium SDU3-3]|nr:HXXEE domain-containing protein [Chloroflexia bacterium SDU3-3]
MAAAQKKRPARPERSPAMERRDPDEAARHMRPLLWAVPLSILIHNIEEFPQIVPYAQRHGVPIRMRPMGIAVALATLLPLPLTMAAVRRPSNRRLRQAAMASAALMACNAAAHLAQTIALRERSPGAVTGLCVNLPLAVAFYRRAIACGYLAPREARRAALVGVALMAPAALILQLVGHAADWALRTMGRTGQP